MPGLQTIQQVRDSLKEAGNTVGSTAGAFSKGVGSYVCTLYKKYPDWVTGKAADIPGFVSGVRDSFLRETCGPPNAPPPPPFTGGQCPCRLYAIKYTRPNGGVNTMLVAAGPIYSITYFTTTSSAGVMQNWRIVHAVCTNNVPTSKVTKEGTIGIGQPVPQAFLEFADSGPPVECGNPPSPGPGIPTQTEFNQTVNVNVVNTIEPTLNLTIPFVFNNFSIDLDVPLNFKVGVNVGGPTFNLTFGPEGIDIPPSGPGSGPGNPSPIPPGLGDKIDKVGEKVKQCCPDDNIPKPPTNFDKKPVPSDGPKQEDGILQLAYVEVEMTSFPKNASKQFGNGGPDLVYAGWFEFRRGTHSFPRQPIHFHKSIFKAPSGADGYAYTLYSGYFAKHVVYKTKPEV